MFWQAGLTHVKSSLLLQPATDRSALSHDVASQRSARLLSTGLGFAVLWIAVSVFAPLSLTLDASPTPSHLVAPVAFNPSALGPADIRLGERSTFTRLLGRAPGTHTPTAFRGRYPKPFSTMSWQRFRDGTPGKANWPGKQGTASSSSEGSRDLSDKVAALERELYILRSQRMSVGKYNVAHDNLALASLVDMGDAAVDTMDIAWEKFDAVMAANTSNMANMAHVPVKADMAADVPSYLQLYRHNLDDRHTTLWEAQNWGLKDGQELRFDVFAKEIDFNGMTVLDVGCGQGDFAKYLEANGIVPARLVGIDGIPEFVEAAEQVAPPWAEYMVGDVVADPSVLGSEWDFIILSGSLTTFNPSEQKRVLSNCWHASRRGIAFNFLTSKPNLLGRRTKPADPCGSIWNANTVMGRCLWTMRPTSMLIWAGQQPGARAPKLIDNYLASDATIIMQRGDVWDLPAEKDSSRAVGRRPLNRLPSIHR